MRISDWSSDVCSSDILNAAAGDDPAGEGLAETPARVARAYREWFAGYRVDPLHLLNRTFGEAAGYDETVLLRSIPLVSTCEHHLAPILGVAHVAYRPRDRVVGISKLSRLVDAYARRLQLQERLTRQIAHALNEALQPRGVAVIIERSEEHTSELQSLMRISYAVFCLKKKKKKN